jgi:hypothetical protein
MCDRHQRRDRGLVVRRVVWCRRGQVVVVAPARLVVVATSPPARPGGRARRGVSTAGPHPNPHRRSDRRHPRPPRQARQAAATFRGRRPEQAPWCAPTARSRRIGDGDASAGCVEEPVTPRRAASIGARSAANGEPVGARRTRAVVGVARSLAPHQRPVPPLEQRLSPSHSRLVLEPSRPRTLEVGIVSDHVDGGGCAHRRGEIILQSLTPEAPAPHPPIVRCALRQRSAVASFGVSPVSWPMSSRCRRWSSRRLPGRCAQARLPRRIAVTRSRTATGKAIGLTELVEPSPGRERRGECRPRPGGTTVRQVKRDRVRS